MGSSIAGWASASTFAVLLTAWVAVAQDAPLPPAPVNAGFETLAGGAPTGWTVEPVNPARYGMVAVAGRTGKAVRIHRTAPGEPGQQTGVTLFQFVDATAYRGKRVRLRASFKVDKPGRHVGMGMRVWRPEPKFAGFGDTMEDRPLAASGWGEHQLYGRVTADATRIWIAIEVRGDADATIDDLTLEVAPPDARPPSDAAKDYLMKAIGILRESHIDSRTADWPRITADALADIAGAQTPADTYPAIHGVIGALGEKHSYLLTPGMLPGGVGSDGGGGAPPPPKMPASELVDGRFGVVRLPGLNTFGPQGAETGKSYTATLRAALETMDKAPICGWIVDLRKNDGGNMWPMLNGIDPLLGEGPFGAFVDPAGNLTQWRRAKGKIFATSDALDPTPLPALAHSGAPVAVLLSGITGSSGEMTAIALIGRPGVRTFGALTGGYTTGNSPVKLSDGALLIVTDVFIRDRTGKPYDGSITPDELTPPEDAQAAAIRWLSGKCKPA